MFERNRAVQLLIDPGEGAIVDANAAAALYYGYPVEALRGKRISEINVLDPEAIRAEMERAVSEERICFRFRHRLASGEVREVEVHSSPIEIEGRTLLHSIVHDTTDRARAETSLREAEEKYRTLVEGSLAGVYIIQDDRFVYVNPRMAELFGYPPEEMIGRPAIDFTAPADHELVAKSLARPFDGGSTTVHYAFRGVRRDGREIDLEALCSWIEYGGRPAFAGTILDMTERRRSEELRTALYGIASESAAVQDIGQLFASIHRIVGELMDARNFYVALLDPAGDVIRFPYFVDERDPAPVSVPVGRGLTDYLLRTGQPLLASPEKTEDLVRCGEVEILGSPSVDWLGVPLKSGTRTIGAIVVQSYTPETGFGEREKELLLFVSQHVSSAIESRRAEEQIRHLAFHDVLTNLPNRMLFNDRLTLAVARACRGGRHLAVMFVDVDRFKVINDSLGHGIGDDLLRSIADRVGRLLRSGDTLARLGGDEFILLLPEIGGVSDAVRVAEKVLQSIRQPFDARDQELYITASAGVSVYPFDGADAETLVKNADIAMYRAKEQGRDNFQLYTAELNARAQARMKLESDLRAGLRRDEFSLLYQPQVDLATGAVCGLEALVAWDSPEGTIPPAEFIPIAEETGLILPLGAWVIRRACRQWKEWQRAGLPPVPVAVNLSARQFQQQDLAQQIEGILRAADVEPRWIDLEITESIAMENADQALAILNRLKRLGVRLTIDDFGTGYSSLAYLRRFPLDALKIDRAFVCDLEAGGPDEAVVGAVVALAHGIGLRVTAEGVETEAQRGRLAALGCDGIQGFLVSRPVDAGAIPDLIGRGSAAS